MRDPRDDLASWASIFGSIIALLGLIQSQAWLAAIGASILGISIVALGYAWRGRRTLKSASITIEGRNLDSLNIANLRRRRNRSLVVQHAYHLAKIDEQDLTVLWQYDGYCRADKETSIEFSIDSESIVPFDELECFAYDLQEDPQRLHKIRPMLVGSDGLSKKIAVPFLKPLLSQQQFSILLSCHLPGCMGTGVRYFTSTLSFDQRSISRLAVHLVFARSAPDWIRVYDCDKHGRPSLAGELRPFRDDRETCEYVDLCENLAGQSVRIYVFQLGPPVPRISRDERGTGFPGEATGQPGVNIGDLPSLRLGLDPKSCRYYPHTYGGVQQTLTQHRVPARRSAK